MINFPTIRARRDGGGGLYKDNPAALHLRAMNMLYEGMKDKGSLIIVPSSALETMNLGVLNYAAMKQGTEAAKPTSNGSEPGGE